MSKIALVTGATSGFGEAIALEFAKNGYNIIITGRRRDRLQKLKGDLEKKHNIEVLSLNFDVRNREETNKTLSSLPAKWQSIDVLVNNAGLASGMGAIQDGDIDDWEKMIDTNVKGLLYVTRCISPMMIKNQKGHIINIGSIAGKEVYANGNVYCATKHAVDALTKAMRIDLLQHGIRVTGICPGMAETEFSVVRFHGDVEKAKNVYKGFEPLKATDIADSVYWAASRPAHVNISDMVIMPLAQANAGTVARKNS
ncbi:MAG TPA: SDR family oxidoreductase [Bacteroidia bacterium]|jgi:3-hydroxy acid dehydrogenase/malonic semialdehyde reductase|nr:SDR family oxidoreductase [Bacteroidia bacterium]